jgi:hypothetical protein
MNATGETFASRLEAAGFVDARIERRPEYNTFKFSAPEGVGMR